MMKRNVLDDEMLAGIGARRAPGRKVLRRSAVTDEMRDLDVGFLDSLIHDLGEGLDHASEAERAAERGVGGPGPSEALAASLLGDAPERTRRAARPDAGDRANSQELADAWMLKGGKAPLLTSAQEIVIAKRIENGDPHAREELLNANVRLVASVARRYLNRGLALEDLMQEGLIGLMRAIDKFNYRKGFRFSTYATHWIRQSVSRAVANFGRSVRLPAHLVDTIGRVARVRDELFQQLGRPPSRAEVAEAAGMTEAKLAQVLRNALQPVSLDTPVGDEGESRLGDFVPADLESSPADRMFRRVAGEALEHALSSLTPRERDVLELRYGLRDGDALTLEETGRRLHITRERARQIEGRAMEKLRHPHTTARLREALT